MEEKEINVPYIVHESEMARLERTIKRLTQIILICIALIFASNMVWLYYWNQYDYVGEESYVYDQDGLGVNIIGTHNEVRNGADSNSKTEESETEEE